MVDEEIREHPEKEIYSAIEEIEKIILFNKNNSNSMRHYQHPYGSYKNEFFNEKITNYTCNDISVLLCIKDRPERFKIFYSFLESFLIKYNINLIIAEGKSDNIIDKQLFIKNNNVHHYLIDLGNKWSRSVLLNFAADKCNTEILILSDVDFIYSQAFWSNIEKMINKVNLNKVLIGLPLYETHDTYSSNNKLVREKYESFSACYLIKKDIFLNVGGFNTRFTGYGWEERELQKRLKLNNFFIFYSGLEYPDTYVLHYSHSNSFGRDSLTNKINLKLWKEQKLKKIEFKTNLS